MMKNIDSLKSIFSMLLIFAIQYSCFSQTQNNQPFWVKVNTKIVYNAKNSFGWRCQNNKTPFQKYLTNPKTDIMVISNGVMIISPERHNYIVSQDEGKTWSPVERNNKHGGAIDVLGFTISHTDDFFVLHNHVFGNSAAGKKYRQKPYEIYISYDGKKWEKAGQSFIPEHYYFVKNGSLAKIRNTEVIGYFKRKGWGNTNHRVIHHLYDNTVTLDTLREAYQRMPSGTVQIPANQYQNTAPKFMKYILNPCKDYYYEVGGSVNQPVYSHEDLDSFEPYEFANRINAVGVLSLKPIGNLRMGIVTFRQDNGKKLSSFAIKETGKNDWIHIGGVISRVTYNPKTRYLYGIRIVQNGFTKIATLYRSARNIDSDCSQ